MDKLDIRCFEFVMDARRKAPPNVIIGQGLQRRRRANSVQPFGPECICTHPFVASRLL
ncbi:hypothetical protein [Thiobacillus denitrificans]|uniref:hypothetical protein n=1 Tax=Thiobacillus denitrificans TaxID=36861 RepID=UPI0012FCB678|nr:hypothetical protein [Thiobacillus denitrificans]